MEVSERDGALSSGRRDTWDKQQGALLPEREARFQMMLDLIDACLPSRSLNILDLACGLGSIAERVLTRFPDACITCVDVDPVLLALLRETLGDDPRVTIAERNLVSESWSSGLSGPFDAVLSATALHWLDATTLARIYSDAATLVRAGGYFVNADHMPIRDRTLSRAAEIIRSKHTEREQEKGAMSWSGWWEAIELDAAMADRLTARGKVFPTVPPELWLPEAWHIERLCASGFQSADVIWRHGNDAVLAAVR